MARFGKYKVRFRKPQGGFMAVIMRTIRFVLYMYAGGLVLVIVGTILNLSGNPFLSAFNLLGYTDDGDGTASISSNSLIGITGILGAIGLITQFVSVRHV